MTPKQAQYDELRVMGSITPVGVILRICNINYNCSQLDYGETCNFVISWCIQKQYCQTPFLVNYIQVIRQ